MPSPYNGAVGSIPAARVCRLSEETINWASLSSSAVSALLDRFSFIAGSLIFPVSSHQAIAIIARGFGRSGGRPSAQVELENPPSITTTSPVTKRFDWTSDIMVSRSEEHTSELQSHVNLVCRLLLEKKK